VVAAQLVLLNNILDFSEVIDLDIVDISDGLLVDGEHVLSVDLGVFELKFPILGIDQVFL
jgi:hypothetical protein